MPLLFLAAMAWGQMPVRNTGNISSISNTRPSSQSAPNPAGMPAGESDTTHTHSDEDSVAGGINGIVYHKEIPDSVLQESVYIFNRKSMQIKIMDIFHPTLSPTGAQFHDVLEGFNGNYYLSVTELGHPHYALFPTLESTPGLVYKNNIYPGFYKTPDNICLYQVKNPYTVLSYNSSLNNDYQVHLTHTQNINNHWNYAMDYHLFSPDGMFANSKAVDHLLDITTNYYSADSRYLLAAGFIWQQMKLGENQGLSNPSAFIDRRTSNMSGIPMVSSSGGSYNNDVTLFVRQSFNTVRQFAWYRPIKEQYTDTVVTADTLHITYFDTVSQDSLWRDSIVFSTRYDLLDSIVGYDTLQPHAPHCYNTGVFALELQWDRQKYRYSDSSLYNQLSAKLFWTNDAYMDHRWHNPLKIYGGVRPEFSWLTLNEDFYTQSAVSQAAFYPFGKVELSPWPATELSVLGEAAPNLSEYNLDAVLLFPFRDSIGNANHRLSLRAVVKATNPELIYYAQTLRAEHPASGDFAAVGVRKLEAEYSRKGFLDLQLMAAHISHNIWFEKTDMLGGYAIYSPVQTEGSALLLQGRVNMYLQLGSWFHYDMQQQVQYSSDQDQIRVPLFASKNSIYADFKVFKGALHSQVGVDVRYHTRFKADAYDPGLGIFYRQNDVEVGNYVWADVFVNLQIKRASIYVKAGHVNSYIENQHYCIIPNYPTKQFGVYFGMTWKFFD